MSKSARRRRHSVSIAAALLTTLPLAVAAPATAHPATASHPSACPWMDTRKSADQRATLLLKASTLDQKLRWLVEHAANNPAQTVFSGVTYPAQVPCTPTVTYTDGPDGVRGTGGVTAFPAPISQAATWSVRLSEQKGRALADEAFGKQKNVVLGPGIASGRTPLSGRTPEYLGEDSLLSGELAAAGIRGIQADGRSGAVLKHYVANEQETDRSTSSSNIDERTLRQVYNLPFEIALDRSDPAGVMCSYNQINSVYACENPILDDVLKDDLGYDGYVVSDFYAVHSTAPSLAAGLDQELNRPIHYTPEKIHQALSAGTITTRQIDEAAYRVVRAYLAAGLFDHALPATAAADVSTAAHRATARAIAEQGSVLLKNDRDILPLKTGRKTTIAVIGATASNTPDSSGISAADACSMRFRDTPAMTCTPVAPLESITARAARTQSSVVFDNGDDVAAAAATAAEADVAVVFGWYGMGEFADPASLSLADGGDALISAVAKANRNTVVVLETGSAVTMPWIDEVRGVIEAWYPGEQQGPALARLLWGDTNFTGKLPMSFPKSIADTPTNTPAQYPGVKAEGQTIRQVDYSEGLAVGYKWYDQQGIDPLFPFGYGLSYTDYRYDRLTVSKQGRDLAVSFRVRNVGDRAGTETSQVYLTLPSSTGEPGKRLVGFRQAALKPGASQTITLKIREKSADHPLSYWDVRKDRWRTAAGTYTVSVGSSSRSLPQSDTIRLN
ncbi:glycoside hydrolase family 3 C-terminal domain-containing protein [Actinoplanes sp. NPDC023714]|uniref:beta-glucosidase n=1 Tax=Actinoplanes sp. NPDC023714 TaxID=3154322 RepID=UPI0033D61531